MLKPFEAGVTLRQYAVETPDLKRLVAGDAVSSVVMALLDDMSSVGGLTR